MMMIEASKWDCWGTRGDTGEMRTTKCPGSTSGGVGEEEKEHHTDTGCWGVKEEEETAEGNSGREIKEDFFYESVFCREVKEDENWEKATHLGG